jgi:2-methylaconitate cis-trans-isomerase PrpF
MHSIARQVLLPKYRNQLTTTRLSSLSSFYRRNISHGNNDNNMTASFPATFARGGTSNGLLIHKSHLPPGVSRWQPILSRAMGSPDSFGRQLNGMGSGISSTSKICVIEKSSRPGVDVDYTFVQVGIKDGHLDIAGNCGNLSSAVGPWAYNEGLVKAKKGIAASNNNNAQGEGESEDEITVRMFNTNTSKNILNTFTLTPDRAHFNPRGDYSIDGVGGTGSKITLSFLDPSGAKTGRALPTSKPVDTLVLPNGTTIRVTLSDIANPGVFILASDLGIPGNISSDELAANTALLSRLEEIRRAGTAAMGLDPNVQSVPKIVILSSPSAAEIEKGVHVTCRALSMQQAHKAVPLTLALNLGAICRIPGTLAAEVVRGAEGKESIRVAHASGTVDVGSVFREGRVESALLHRTARMLMKGDVFY